MNGRGGLLRNARRGSAEQQRVCRPPRPATRLVLSDDVITHTLPLAEAPHAYQIFNDKKDDCLKVVLKPAI